MVVDACKRENGADLVSNGDDMGINVGDHGGMDLGIDPGLNIQVDLSLGLNLELLDIGICNIERKV